jgi:hypothetical protein
MTPAGLLASWTAGLIALPLTLIVAAAGQGFGALAAGGSWIGVSLPWGRQAWALVNQPVLNFASLPSATGYWLGTVAVPLSIALLAMPLSVRVRTLASQLFMVHWAWTCIVIGVLWQPALEPAVSHPIRWLRFRGLAPELWWVVAACAPVVVIPVILRLLAVARITHHHMGRGRRVLVVSAHLLPVPAVWAVVSTAARGTVFPVEAWVLFTIPVALALMVAWIGYPAPLNHPVTSVRGGTIASLVVVAAALWFFVALAGRPLGNDKAAALQWGHSSSFNNIRAWMEPLRAPWLDPPP